MNQYQRSDQIQEDETRAWLAGADPLQFKAWITNSIPATVYSLAILAPALDIKCIDKAFTEHNPPDDKPGSTFGHANKNGKLWHATVKAKLGDRIHMGAATNKDKRIAACFAYRNAIRQLLPFGFTNAELAYRDTQENALRK